ncbi:peptidoglycan-binding domain-containing protein, partial [Pseudomonas citronellolis]|uniref:peptidoglycan-binding domain-containing protein n=1 Tax=Pseudomonas citronellolis TaxID=53408 RepID=UPI00278C34F4
REIHLKAGQKLVIEAGQELTLKAGGSFINLDPSGVTVFGPLAKINAGGSPGSGSGIALKSPVPPGAADNDKAGEVLKQVASNLAASQPTQELGNRLRVQLKRPFEKEGIAGQPYILNMDGIELRGTTAAGGYIDHPISDGAKKATLTFYPFGQEHQAWAWELNINKQAPANEVLGRQSRLKNLGFYSGELDGVDGPKTQYATRCFQRACQLTDKDHITASEQDLLVKQHNV